MWFAYPVAVELLIDELALNAMFHAVDGPIARDLERRGLAVEAAATRLAVVAPGPGRQSPVGPDEIPGFMRAAIDHELGLDAEGLYMDVIAKAPYSIYVELGTQHSPAQPFLRPALSAAAG